MVQATTPTFVLTLPETVDLTEPSHFYFTLRQGRVRIEKSDSDLVIDGQTISVYLSQAETLTLTPGTVKLQLNWTYANGSRDAKHNLVESCTEQPPDERFLDGESETKSVWQRIKGFVLLYLRSDVGHR